MKKVEIFSTQTFDKQYKRFFKKYGSFSTDFSLLLEKLMLNPVSGVELGDGLYKIRLSIKSKQKGKSGGLRIINKLECILKEDQYKLTFVYIYDKSELANVDIKLLKKMLNKQNK